MIRIEGLTKRYGSATVVDDVSFTVPGGDALALWGPNGAGKSTIVRCLLGLARFDGTIEVCGLDVRQQPKATRRLIGYVPQELVFYDDMTAEETLAFSAALRGLGTERGGEVLELVGLTPHAGKRVGALSGGMKQRLAIALALVHDPPVLVLDEPTSSLDAATREAMVSLFEHLRGPERAVLLTSHHLEEVGMLVDRVLTMEDGRVTLECEPAELADRLGIRSWLHVMVPGEQVEAAVELLGRHGFTARRNTRGVIVEVQAQSKGAALMTLQDAGIDVLDLEVWR
ncbi:MAG: ABC transporter ATP-binding protein [Acidimicrobiia bacterium]